MDDRIAALASGQHGVVTRRQLLGMGVTPGAIDGRVRSRRLRPIHGGVYLAGDLVGPLVPARALEMAAVLACGPGAVVSHTSAASLWGLLPPARAGEPVHVTVAGRDRGRRRGLRAHRVARLALDDVTTLDGIPITVPARTLLDVAAVVRPRDLEQALAQADRRNLVDLTELAARVEPGREGRRGAAALRSMIGAGGGPALTRSAAEERLLGLVRSGHLPAPRANVEVAGFEVDFLWEAEGVALEVDGFAYHRSRSRFEDDRRRDAQLAARGLQVVRVTWRQLVDEPAAVLVRLAQILARATGESARARR